MCWFAEGKSEFVGKEFGWSYSKSFRRGGKLFICCGNMRVSPDAGRADRLRPTAEL